MGIEIWNDNWDVGRVRGCIETRTYRNGNRDDLMDTYLDGTVITPHGYVEVMAYTYPNFSVTRLDFIWKGRMYSRSFRSKRYSKRYCVTLAKKFAEDVVEGSIHGDNGP